MPAQAVAGHYRRPLPCLRRRSAPLGPAGCGADLQRNGILQGIVMQALEHELAIAIACERFDQRLQL